VQLDRQAERARGLEHATRLRGREADPFAERVDGIDQAFVVQPRQPVDHGVDVVVGASRELRRQCMRAQIRGTHRDAERLADAARDAQHLALVLDVQAVAGLDLQRGHAVGRARQRLREQLVFARGAHGAHGREDAPTGARDLLVTRALQTQFELMCAIASENDVCMAVDQCRRDPAAVGFDHFAGLGLCIGGQC